MKLVLFFMIVVIGAGCGWKASPDKTRNFIPGTYIRFSTTEFGKEYDTLVISLQNPSADEYKVIRKWKYERMTDATTMEPEYRKKVTTVIYDPEHKLLREPGSGKVYSIDIQKKCLFNGPNKFQKL